MDEKFTVIEAAFYLNCPRWQLANHRVVGRGPKYLTEQWGRRVRYMYLKSDLDAFIEAGGFLTKREENAIMRKRNQGS